MPEGPVSLERHLVLSGLGNRRECARLIRDGKVEVNGRVVRDSKKKVPAGAVVGLEGRPLAAAPLRVLLLHKPRGHVCQTGESAPAALDLLPKGQGLSLVGRLDAQSEGLIIATNDGDLAHRLTHPDHEVVKTYLVTVTPHMDEDTLRRLCSGLMIEGRPTLPLEGRILGHKGNSSTLELKLREGKKRQIRLLCTLVGVEVTRLVREAVGPLKLGSLAPGAWREATPAERRLLERGSGF